MTKLSKMFVLFLSRGAAQLFSCYIYGVYYTYPQRHSPIEVLRTNEMATHRGEFEGSGYGASFEMSWLT